MKQVKRVAVLLFEDALKSDGTSYMEMVLASELDAAQREIDECRRLLALDRETVNRLAADLITAVKHGSEAAARLVTAELRIAELENVIRKTARDLDGT